MLVCVGAKCCTRTKASPVSTDMAWSNWLNASRPLAEAPITTIGNRERESAGDSDCSEGDVSSAAGSAALESASTGGFESAFRFFDMLDLEPNGLQSRCRPTGSAKGHYGPAKS